MKKIIIISPYSKALRDGKKNPKNYPYWQELINLLIKDYHIIQIGITSEKVFDNVEVKFNLSLKELKCLIEDCYIWISVDNFFPHLASHTNKPGIVLWGRSDPKIFGYLQNINLLKNIKYLRSDQFNIWEAVEYNSDVFVKPETILTVINRI